MEGDFRYEHNGIDQRFTRVVDPSCHHIAELRFTLCPYFCWEKGVDSLSEEQERKRVESAIWVCLNEPLLYFVFRYIALGCQSRERNRIGFYIIHSRT